MNRALLASALCAVFLVGCGPPSVQVPPVDLNAEIGRARTENKLLVLEFTGSDWCPGCILFQKKVLSHPEFISYAQSNILWVEVDFPQRVKLPPASAATNELLRAQFSVDPLPSFIALDRDGKEIWRLPAKDDPDPTLTLVPKRFIEQLEAVRRKNG